ncbi:MAG: S1C family serine protease [Blastocatellia bacterium]
MAEAKKRFRIIFYWSSENRAKARNPLWQASNPPSNSPFEREGQPAMEYLASLLSRNVAAQTALLTLSCNECRENPVNSDGTRIALAQLPGGCYHRQIENDMKTTSRKMAHVKRVKYVWLGMWLVLSVTAASAQPLRDMFRRVTPSVVVVHAQKKAVMATTADAPAPDQSIGSGVLIAADGKVLTAAHVVQTAERIEIEFMGGQRVPARVVASAPVADVALLQLDKVPEKAVVASLGDSTTAEVGDQIFIIGAPYGATHSLSVGWVSARRATENAIENLIALETLQLDAAIYEGNSGGPVFNLKGEIIGIVSHTLAKTGSATGLGFAVTSNVARKLLLEDKRVWLGIEGWLIEGALATTFNLPQAAGMLVQSVAYGSLGASLGLQEGSLMMTIGELHLVGGGDVILEMLGQPIRPDPHVLAEIQQQLNRLRSGDQLKVKVLRGGKVLDLSTKIPQ